MFCHSLSSALNGKVFIVSYHNLFVTICKNNNININNDDNPYSLLYLLFLVLYHSQIAFLIIVMYLRELEIMRFLCVNLNALMKIGISYLGFY